MCNIFHAPVERADISLKSGESQLSNYIDFNSVAHLDPEILPNEIDKLLCLRSNP